MRPASATLSQAKHTRRLLQFLAGTAAFIIGSVLSLASQTPSFSNLHVIKKNGAITGTAVVTVRGKVKRLSKQATEAWPVTKGQDALLLVAGPRVAGKSTYILRYYDAQTWKRRTLGTVPFSTAALIEHDLEDGTPVFILSGMDGDQPTIVVADDLEIHGRLRGTLTRGQEEDTLLYRESQAGAEKSIPLSSLLGSDMAGIYEAKTRDGTGQYLQFPHDGKGLMITADGQVKKADWWTDGQSMYMEANGGAPLKWSRSTLAPVDGVPAGSHLIVRLEHPLSSYRAKEGDPVKAVLISPAVINGKVLIPQGAEFSGMVTKVHGVKLGVRHETAALTVEFDSAALPDSRVIAIRARLYQVENSRETVDNNGAIKGIRSTGTPGHSAESKIASVAAFDPLGYLFSTASATAALGFAEPEILYPSGTEMLVEFTAPLITSTTYPSPIPALANTDQERSELVQFVRRLSFRTKTKGTDQPSDLTNLLFLGSPDGLQRAFKAAGWVEADRLTAGSAFQTIKSVSGTEVYTQGPMSVLMLDEHEPISSLMKTTNTFFARHHLRIFDPALRFQGLTVLTSSSTQDIGIAFSAKKKTFIHLIDEYIDNERAKVVNDLVFTGCVEAFDLVPRPWVPQDAYNSTGDRLRTDGAIAVLRMSDCQNPRGITQIQAPPPPRAERYTRNTMLGIRNDIFRGNLGYQGYSGIKGLRNYLLHKNDLKSDPGAWHKSDLSGTDFKGVGGIPGERQPSAHIKGEEQMPPEPVVVVREPSHRWDPPRYEIGVQGGWLRYPNIRFDGIGIILTPHVPDPTLPDYGVLLIDGVDGGWTAGISFTANTWRRFSSEFAYQYQRGSYALAALAFGSSEDIDPHLDLQEVGLVVRQFEYNLLVHARRPQSRWRPYAAIGPALQMFSLRDAPLKKPAGPFKLGLQNVGIFKAAYDFGSTPPLEGGGIFQFGLQYGTGLKFRVHPRLTLRVDFRETLSKNPRFIEKSYNKLYFELEDYDSQMFRIDPPAKYRQQRFTLGAAFTF